ncbi:MAG: hypothetical protein KAJ19_29965 [Gammaproteobacteria bacterium]|nr:hypothetical protein [Gammaproteobacteria bacterium]
MNEHDKVLLINRLRSMQDGFYTDTYGKYSCQDAADYADECRYDLIDDIIKMIEEMK